MQDELLPLLPDLLFPSESDEPVVYLCMEYSDTDTPLSPERLATLLNLNPKVPILEKDYFRGLCLTGPFVRKACEIQTMVEHRASTKPDPA